MFRRADWLKAHAASEKRLRRTIYRFFREQAERIAEAVEASGASASIVPQVLRIPEEHERFMGAVVPELWRIMGYSAFALHEELTARKDWHEWLADRRRELDFDLPPETIGRMRLAMTELTEQDYWQDIQRETSDRAAEIIGAGVESGDGTYAISMTLREEMGGFEARRRALLIARTEVTGCQNAGHMAEAETVEGLGLVVEKVWISAGDSHVRPSHIEASGQRVRGSAGLFVVGGETAPYPGHWSLSARQRVRCRCSFLTEPIGELPDASEPEA